MGREARWRAPKAAFWTEQRPLGQRMIALACFVAPVSAAATYFISGTGALVADLIVCALLLPAIGFGAHRRLRSNRP
jgi:hypothetical protein